MKGEGRRKGRRKKKREGRFKKENQWVLWITNAWIKSLDKDTKYFISLLPTRHTMITCILSEREEKGERGREEGKNEIETSKTFHWDKQ